MKQSHFHRIESTSLMLVAVATLGSLLFFNGSVTLGLALGGILGTLNFYALRRLVHAIANSSNPRKQGIMATILVLKLGIIGGTIYLIIRFVPVSPLAFLVGISIVVLSIFAEGFRATLCGAASRSE